MLVWIFFISFIESPSFSVRLAFFDLIKRLLNLYAE
nr:MAG TPA: hypothetical protein [Caudoviricetes sp.]